MEFFLTVAFLINDVERRFHYQYDSFQECSQAREVMVKDETRRPLWATCTSGKAPPPSVYQKEFQDQLMPGQLLKGAPGLEKKKMSDMGRTPYSETTSTRRPRSTGGVISPMTLNLNGQHERGDP